MHRKAYAKINLFLDVVSKRDDGFHCIESVMHTVSVFDDIYVDVVSDGKGEIILKCDDKTLETSENLVYRAASIYMQSSKILDSLVITLNKKIPIGAGLGGGSSDAACILRMLNDYYKKLSEDEILDISAKIGSDVSFCYYGKTAFCEGTGNLVFPLAFTKKLFFVIAIGDERISTPLAYKVLDDKYSNFDGSVVKRCNGIYDSDILGFTNKNGEQLPLYNIFDELISKKIQCIDLIKKEMLLNGAIYAMMSGSGPSVFGIYNSSEDAKLAEKRLLDLGYSAFFCESV